MTSNCLKALIAGSLLAGLSVAPALAEFKLDGDPKVAMIIFAQKNDGGWSQAFDEARQRMEKEMGVKIPYRRERSGERHRHHAAGRALHQQGLQRHHRLGLRLLRHLQGARREIPEGRLPQRRRHHQRPQPRVLLRPHLRDPVSLRHGGRRGVEDRQARLRRGQSLRPRQLDRQRLRDGRQADQSERHHHRHLHRRLERPGQGARRRRGPHRAGHRRHRPACRHARRADRSAGEGHLLRPAITATSPSSRPRRRSARRSGCGTSSSTPRSRRSPPAPGPRARTAPSSASRTAARTSPAAAPRYPRRTPTRSWPSARRSSTASRSMPDRSRIATARSASPPVRSSVTATCGRWTGS